MKKLEEKAAALKASFDETSPESVEELLANAKAVYERANTDLRQEEQSLAVLTDRLQQAQADGTLAAPMLAQLIKDAGRGDHNAVIMLGGMAEQMSAIGGDMANLGAVLKDMIDGERDIDRLCTRMGPQGESLITQILSELGKIEVH